MHILTRKVRIAIMCLLITVFFVIAPIILLYTAGYRYDFSAWRIKQTGVLNIDAEPADVTAFLNGVKQKNKLPLYLPNRAPGTYRLKLSKTGYKTWEKDITIESNKTAYIKNVTLFKESLPTQLLDDELKIVSILPSTDGKYITLLRQEAGGSSTVDLYNTETAERKSIWRAKTTITPSVHWSPYGNWLLLQEPGVIQIIDATNPISTNTLTSSSTIQSWQWAPIFAIYLQSTDEVILMDANGRQKYANTSTTVWFADGEDGWQYDTSNKCLKYLKSEQQKCVYDMPEQIESFISADANKFILKTNDNNILLIRVKKNELKEVKKLPVQNTLYNTQTREWLVWSPWELWTIYEDGTATLLNRTSDQITFVNPLDKDGLLLLASENKITGFNPGYYVTHELFSNGKIDSIGADIVNRKIYFLGEVGGKRGVWGLEY